MSKESYARGFCKAAEAHGVDPTQLAKYAVDASLLAGKSQQNAANRLSKNVPSAEMLAPLNGTVNTMTRQQALDVGAKRRYEMLKNLQPKYPIFIPGYTKQHTGNVLMTR